jgi:hypothetical protein
MFADRFGILAAQADELGHIKQRLSFWNVLKTFVLTLFFFSSLFKK